MIRIIVRESTSLPNGGGEVYSLKSVDIEHPELEDLLRQEGYKDTGYETQSIHGYELITKAQNTITKDRESHEDGTPTE